MSGNIQDIAHNVLIINANRDSTGYEILVGQRKTLSIRPSKSPHVGGAVDPYFILRVNRAPASARNFSVMASRGQIHIEEAVIVYGDNDVVAPYLRLEDVVLIRTSLPQITGHHLIAMGAVIFMENAATLAAMGSSAYKVIEYQLRNRGISSQVAGEAARLAVDPQGPGYHIHARDSGPYGTIIIVRAPRVFVMTTNALSTALRIGDSRRLLGLLRRPTVLDAKSLAELIVLSKYVLA